MSDTKQDEARPCPSEAGFPDTADIALACCRCADLIIVCRKHGRCGLAAGDYTPLDEIAELRRELVSARRVIADVRTLDANGVRHLLPMGTALQDYGALINALAAYDTELALIEGHAS